MGKNEKQESKDEEQIQVEDGDSCEEVNVSNELSDAMRRAEDAQKKVLELTDVCQRLQADFDNYRKRNIEQAKRIKEDSVAEVVIKFLPVLDVVDRAIAMIEDSNVLSGLSMIRKQLIAIFEENGVKEINALNQDFDPNFHNAVLCVDDPENSGKVVEVMQKGYICGDKVIRHSAVKIAK